VKTLTAENAETAENDLLGMLGELRG